MLKANFEGETISNFKSEENHPLSNVKVPFEVYVAHQQSHVEAAKILADFNRDTFGFITRGAFYDAFQEGSLIVALCEENVIGFLRYHHRKRDLQTTLYDICVAETKRGQGVGTALLGMLIEICLMSNREFISLKCPVDSSANIFYRKIGFKCTDISKGKKRDLNVWQLNLFPRGL